MTQAQPALAIVLAAGGGTRMRSALPKVLHEIGGRPLVGHVLAAVEATAPMRTAVVVGAGRELVEAVLPAYAQAVLQAEQRGTGHAVRIALEAVEASAALDDDATVLIVPGDSPLLRGESLVALLERHLEQAAVCTLLTAEVADPTGYGRVVRDGALVRAVVEERDADLAQKQIREVATSVYAVRAGALRTSLRDLSTGNAQGEEYLTDIVATLAGRAAVVQAWTTEEADETAGVNDRVQLAAAGRILNARLVERAMRAGVGVVDPATTWLGVDVTCEPDCTLLPGTTLAGRTSVAGGAVVGPYTTLTDSIVGPRARVRFTEATGAEIGPDVSVGPYTYLRPGTRLGPGAKAGAFVEIKASSVGAGSKVPHLSYVGDAEIGAGTNIGCGTVFVNYDGVAKHRTVVGDQVRVGSDTMLVAPVTVGDGAYTAAGSVVTDDVPAGAMAVGRSRQRNVEGWVARRRPGSPSAEAAAAAGQASSTSEETSP